MSTAYIDITPEELSAAAATAIADAKNYDYHQASEILANAGLCGVCASEDAGGLGLGIEFAVPLVSEAGKLQLQWPLLETILLAKALGSSPLATELCSGLRSATWAWQGDYPSQWAGHARFANRSDWVLVANGQEGAVLLDLSTIDVHLDEALDPESPQAWLALDNASVLATLDAATFAVLKRDSQILIASMVNGAAEGALNTTATYLSARVQFGRPITAKQAARHTLARMRLLQDATHAGIQRVLHIDEFGRTRDSAAMLSYALSSAAFVLEKAIHLHGGMGFTWEVPLHYALREVRKFDAAFGAGGLAQKVGHDFILSI